MKPIIIVATDEEYMVAKNKFKKHRIIKTGVGGLNVIKKLKRIPRWIPIINFGYAGSNNIDIGTEVEITSCKLYHPNVEYAEPIYMLKFRDGVPCYTSNDFVLETTYNKACVFDMELAYIMALGFKNVKAIKIVSDNLSLHEYEKTIKK